MLIYTIQSSGEQTLSSYPMQEERIEARGLGPKTALAVPTAPEASAMEAATHAMAPKISKMCDTHTVCEAAPAEMSGTKVAIHTYGATHAMIETAASEMGGTYAVVKTHAVMDDAPIGADVHMAEAMAVPAIKYSPVGIIVIAKVIRACRGTAVSRIVHRLRRTGVLAGIGLGSGWLRSSKCGRGQPNGGSQQDHFGPKFAAGHRSLLWGFAPQFKLIPKWNLGGICGGRQLASGTPLLAEDLAGVMMQVPGAFAASMGPRSQPVQTGVKNRRESAAYGCPL